MVRVSRPLFSDTASGNLGDIGTFRHGRYGPELIAISHGTGGNSPEQQTLRACFEAAKAAHSQIVPTLIATKPRKRYKRFPSWPDFWRQWLIDHPDCRP